MIIRRHKKPKATSAAPTPEVADIAALAPFQALNQALAQTVAAASTFLVAPRGRWNYHAGDGNLYFLLNGKLLFSAEGNVPRTLHAEEPASRFPLPLDADWRIDSSGEAGLLRVPARFLEGARDQLDEGQGQFEFAADDVGGQIFLDFHRSIMEGQCELPSMPDLALRIGRVVVDPDTLNDDIARLIQLDPSLAARMMSVVNSAAYGAGQPIKTLQQAVARLGRKQVHSLVFSCIVKGLFRTDSALLKNRMRALWKHSTRVAAISFVLAKYTPGLDPERALLAGLIHDIGAIPILEAARNNPNIADDADMLDRVIGHLKADLGAMTLREWGFDDELMIVAQQADHWQRTGSALADYLDVVLLAQLHAHVGTAHMRDLPRIDQIPAFQKLALGQLTPRHSIGLLERAARDIEEIEQLLQVA